MQPRRRRCARPTALRWTLTMIALLAPALGAHAATATHPLHAVPTPHPTGLRSALPLHSTPMLIGLAHPPPGPAGFTRPTPQPTGLSRPTPAPTSQDPDDDTDLVDDAQFVRTEVHVLEKCCPYVSHFSVRHYPSAMEEDGWVPGLTFHAFQYNPSLPNCWQIVDATDAAPGSQLWKRVDPDKADPSRLSAFCLPTENRLPDPRFSVFYIETADKRASFVSQPMSHTSRTFFDTFSLAGWISRAQFEPVHFLAYYYWRPLMPLRLIADVRMRATEEPTLRECDDGYEPVPGNLNHNFVLEPVLFFCVRYAHGGVMNPFLNTTVQATDDKFLTKIEVHTTTSKPLVLEQEALDQADEYRQLALQDPNYQRPERMLGHQRPGSCGPGREAVQSSMDLWRRSGSQPQDDEFDKLNETFLALKLDQNYTVYTGRDEWLTFCMTKEPLVVPGGKMNDASKFIDRLFLNSSRVARKSRLGFVYNFDQWDLAKQSPNGRLFYDEEEEEDEEEKEKTPTRKASDEL